MGIKGRIPSIIPWIIGLGLSTPAFADRVELHYSSGVTSAQQKEVEKDLSLLDRVDFVDSSGEMQRIMHMPDTRGSSLESWLSERMHYLLEINHPVDSSLNSSGETLSIGAVMTNIGASIYQEEKRLHRRLSFQIQGIGSIPVTSPRVGIFQLDSAFFKPFYENHTVTSIHDFVNVVYRLATFFHEARHTDGNGSSAGFLHTVCPRGNAYEGLAACDSPSNGPYRIGAMLISSIEEGCQKCSVGTKAALDVLRLDSVSRILSPIPKRFQMLSAEELALTRLNPFGDDTAVVGQGEKILEWDDTPEGL